VAFVFQEATVATFALTNQTFVFNSVNLSDHTYVCTIVANADQLDSHTFGDSWKEYTGGLKAGTVNVTFYDDFASGSVDATVWSAFNTGTAVAVTSKPVNTTTSATNPEYQFNVLPNQWQFGGSIGTMAGKTLTFPITGAITRATS
jgi:hypothetical protein